MIEKIKQYWDNQIPYLDNNIDKNSIEHYNDISKHRYELHPHVKNFVKFEKYKNKKVLEIGFGAGTDLCEFVRNGADVSGIDISDKSITLCNDRLIVENFNADIKLYDGLNIPFKNNTFDAVYSWGVLHHNPNIDDLLSEAHRVLKPGGNLILMLYNKYSLLYYYSILYLRWLPQKIKSRHEILSDYSEFCFGCPHTDVYNESEIKDKLWYFNSVNTEIDFVVYDSLTDRKINILPDLNDIKTGISDIDYFFNKYNNDIKCNDISKYGWHLMVNAIK